MINSLYFRVRNGSAVSTGNLEYKAMRPKLFYYAKEVVRSGYTSIIMPKGSPVQVNQFMFSFILLCR